MRLRYRAFSTFCDWWGTRYPHGSLLIVDTAHPQYQDVRDYLIARQLIYRDGDPQPNITTFRAFSDISLNGVLYRGLRDRDAQGKIAYVEGDSITVTGAVRDALLSAEAIVLATSYWQRPHPINYSKTLRFAPQVGMPDGRPYYVHDGQRGWSTGLTGTYYGDPRGDPRPGGGGYLEPYSLGPELSDLVPP
jgi:hypothetical protein